MDAKTRRIISGTINDVVNGRNYATEGDNQKKEKNMENYPLYDVPYLVRDPNEFRMSKKRHEIEVRNQAVVDDYFMARDKGLSGREARRLVEEKHHLRPERFHYIFVQFYREAQKRRKYDFLEKFFTPDGTLK